MIVEDQNIDNDDKGTGTDEQVVSAWKVVEDNTINEPVTKLYEDKPAEVVEEVEQKAEEVVETVVETVVEEEAEEQEVDEDAILAYIREKKGINANSFDDLKPKEVLEVDEETKKFLEYKKETGRGYADFLETQKDYSQEPKEKVLLQGLKLENPTLTDSQIERLYKRKYEYDAEYDDEDVILDKQIDIEKDYQKVISLLESQKEKYMVRRGSDETIPDEYKTAKELVDNWNKQQEENKVALEKSRADFIAKTDGVFTKDFEGFKVKVGEQEFKIKPENLEVAKSTLSDLSNFDKKFFDQQTGELKDPAGYYRALHFAMNPDEVAKHFISVGKAMQAEQDEIESKNIKDTSARSVNTGLNTDGKKWTVVE